eukprot:TRINITY_DN1772_c0_g2_i1.p1 TRINITY_DN1772_c0_g2~~TRINITY_DN1772_c0_g2_i1.p1  ORF type:complete len:958 (+),score=300.73 TRINITY_DN1772_c0_g2_i1:60-2933(+)
MRWGRLCGRRPQATPDEGIGARLVGGYVEGLVKYRWLLMAVTICVTVPAAVLAPRFLDRTTQDFAAPEGSPAAEASRQMRQYFPILDGTTPLMVYIEKPAKKASVLSEAVANFSTTLCEQAAAGAGDAPLVSCLGYYALEQIGPEQGKQYLAASETATFLAVVIKGGLTAPATIAYSTWLSDSLPAFAAHLTASGYTVSLMGSTPFLEVMIDAATRDLERMDAIVLPLAFLVLAYILQSVRFVLLTGLSLGLSLAVSFAIMYGVTFSFPIFASSPSLMMSISIAMSIDYSMFLLSRYREELEAQVRRGRAPDTIAAIPAVVRSAGHTIVVSGLTLSLCFFGLLYFDINVMQSLGICCGVSILVVLLCNLFVVPLMLVCFPHFFARGAAGPNACLDAVRFWKKDGSGAVEDAKGTPADPATERTPLVAEAEGGDPTAPSHAAAVEDSAAAQPGRCVGVVGIISAKAVPGEPLCREVFSRKEDETLPPSSEGYSRREEHSERLLVTSRWYRLSKLLVRPPYNFLVPLVIITIVAPFGLFAYTYKTTDENILYLPDDVAVTKAYKHMGNEFGVGYAFPYQILMVPKEPGAKIIDESNTWKVWFETRDIITELSTMNQWKIGGDDFQTASLDGVQTVCPGMMTECIQAAMKVNMTCADIYTKHGLLQRPGCPANVLLACEYLNNNSNTFDLLNSEAMWAKFSPEFSPMGTDGSTWLDAARAKAAQRAADKNKTVNFFIVGGAADALDSMHEVDGDYATMVGITCSIVFVLTCVAFRSIVVGIRSIITIATTITFVYGFATLTYQEGILTWTGFNGFAQTHAIVYIIPLMSFTILVGISLDYDMFLLTRIVEYRARGFSTRQAVCQASAKTGFLITAAGVIMAIAFSGLFFSAEPYMHQLSFFMVFAVLFDTFVVRTLMVPALMGLLGEYNWWPCAHVEVDTQECAPIAEDVEDPAEEDGAA